MLAAAGQLGGALVPLVGVGVGNVVGVAGGVLQGGDDAMALEGVGGEDSGLVGGFEHCHVV